MLLKEAIVAAGVLPADRAKASQAVRKRRDKALHEANRLAYIAAASQPEVSLRQRASVLLPAQGRGRSATKRHKLPGARSECYVRSRGKPASELSKGPRCDAKQVSLPYPPLPGALDVEVGLACRRKGLPMPRVSTACLSCWVQACLERICCESMSVCVHAGSCAGKEIEEFNKVLMMATERYTERKLGMHMDGGDDDTEDNWTAHWGGASDSAGDGVSVVEIPTVENGDCFFDSISKLAGFQAQREVLSVWMSENLDKDLGLEACVHTPRMHGRQCTHVCARSPARCARRQALHAHLSMHLPTRMRAHAGRELPACAS